MNLVENDNTHHNINTSNIKLLYLNIRGIFNKLYKNSILYNYITSNDCGIITFSETKLSDIKAKKLFSLDGYRCYKIDAIPRLGGRLRNGMCALIKNEYLTFTSILKCDSKFILPIKLELNEYTLIYISIYIPQFNNKVIKVNN